ncbi:MAG: von Willebrand factor A domain-containing protein 5A, partial [Watsoniomyces obsoletus]
MAYTFCGCWFPIPAQWGGAQRQYLPQVQLESHTTILSTTSRTTLKQIFVNSQDKKLDEVQYTFPLYDGVSIVGFKCTVADKVLVGVVKEKQQARKDYQEAIDRGETAGLLEQVPEASDAFTTKVGNVPAGERIHVEITYLGELKHDAETDGARFTIPTVIAPRYGSVSHDTNQSINKVSANADGGIKITVDVGLEEGSVIRGLQSP